MHHEALILIGAIIIAQSAMSPKLILVHGVQKLFAVFTTNRNASTSAIP